MSLAVQAVFFGILRNWSDPAAEPGTWANLTNGPYGLAGIPRPRLAGVTLNSEMGIAALSLATAGVGVVLSWWVLSSPFGLILRAVRDDEVAARALGKNTRLVRVQVFAIACGLAAAAGVLYSAQIGYIEPGAASVDESVLMICMVIVGGSGNRLLGPLTGAAVLLALPEVLRQIHLSGAVASGIRLLLYGSLLVLMMHVRPQGLAGEYRVE